LHQLLTESVVVACAGGVLGVGVAAVGVRGLLALAPAGAIPRDQELGLDPVVLGFALAVSVATGIAFGLAPALKSTRRELRDTLSQGSRTHSGGGGPARGALVVAELALAVVLLTGAGLLLRSFQEIRSIDVGFDPEGALTFYVDLPADAYGSAEAAIALHERVLEGLAGISGVEAAGGANFEPFGPLSLSTRVRTEDGAPGRTATGWTTVSPGYFRAMDIPVLVGRGFNPTDDAVAPPVAVVSRTLARQLWPDREAVGQHLLEGDGASVSVVGVVGDVVESDVLEDQRPLMYRPFMQNDYAPQLHHMSYVVRTDVSAAGMAAAMREVVREADPDIPIGSVASMDDVVLDSLADRVFQMRVLGAFAVLALLLAAVGVYGVTAYSVRQRGRELGIRLALGARGRQVAALALRQALALAAVGLLVGSAVAAGVTRLIEASLYDVAPSDPVTYGAVAVVLAVVVLAAALVPARYASRVDPMKVLGT
jgi:putative ABC transport system permease protein